MCRSLKGQKKNIACSIEYSGVVTLRCTDSTSTRLIFVSETGTNTFTCVWPQTYTSVLNLPLYISI